MSATDMLMRAIATVLFVWVAAACGSSSSAPPDAAPPPSGDVVAETGVPANPAIDLVFVLDDSGAQIVTMQLVDAVDSLVAALDRRAGGRPDLHVGVVSQDMGAGPYEIDGCDEGGLDGALLSTPRITGCSPPDGAFIRDVDDGAGGRDVNYTEPLADTIACVANLGIDGCGFEQPLAALVRALDPAHPINAGFRRPNAVLGVVILMDEDDCSASDTAVYDPSQTDIDDPLGPLHSFRCFEFGVVCDGDDDPRAVGPRTGCRPREDSPYIAPVSDFVAAVREAAGGAEVAVATIIGDTDHVEVRALQGDGVTLDESCAGENGAANPGIRLEAFARAFGHRAVVRTACDGYARHLDDVGGTLLRAAGTPCVTSAVVEPSRCTAWLVDGDGLDVALSACSDADPPCWQLVDGGAECSAFPTGLRFEVSGSDAHAVLYCEP